MPPARPKDATCLHEQLTFTPSTHAAEAQYKPRSTQELQAAGQLSQKAPTPYADSGRDPNVTPWKHSWNFPAPLVLPDDDLALDPDYPGQTSLEWRDGPYRNSVNDERRTIYVCAPPSISEEVASMRDWCIPFSNAEAVEQSLQPPATQDVLEYLSAFYHGLPVKLFKQDLRFTAWDEEAKPRKTPQRKVKGPDVPKYVALATDQAATRIRVRAYDNTFTAQLNLSDLLDVAISIVPKEAYAILMLVDYDVYEDETDDFCCGRAYGGSRVAVVSSARYNPVLDSIEQVDRSHAWPASHCINYLTGKCQATKTTKHPKKKAKTTESSKPKTARLDTPLHAAVQVHAKLQKDLSARSNSEWTELWLGRLCKTASHELGHCFGMDHCVHYACIMQGTTSLAEDARQPPYLCPIDERKVFFADGGADAMETNRKGHYEALRKFCEKHKDTELFVAFGAWLTAKMEKSRADGE